MANETKTVLIGCRLPHGLVLKVTTERGEKITAKLNGMNSSVIKGATYTTTAIDSDLWEQWKKLYSNYSALKNGSIFEARSADHAKHMAKELAEEPTGFEAMNQDDLGIKPAAKD